MHSTNPRRRLVRLAAVSAAALILAGNLSANAQGSGFLRAGQTPAQAPAPVAPAPVQTQAPAAPTAAPTAQATADGVALENFAFEAGGASYRIPRALVSGTSLSPSDLSAIFDPKSSEPLPARLAKLTAKRITIPEFVMEQKIGDQRQVARYRNVVLADVQAGRAATLTGEGASIEVTGGRDGNGRGTMGAMTVSGMDLAGMARLYLEKAADASAPMQRIYESFSIENFSLQQEGTEIAIARVSGRDFLARPTRNSLSEDMRALEKLENPDKPTPADTTRLLAIVTDLFGATQVGQFEITGMTVKDQNAKDKAVGRIARIAYTGTAGGQPAEARIEGFEVQAEDGQAKIASIVFTGFSFEPTLEGLRRIEGKPLDQIDQIDLRKLIPTIGTVRFSGLDFDVPNEASDTAGPGRVRFTVQDVTLTADKPVNGVPTNLRMAMDRLVVPVPAKPEDETMRELAAMGYKSVDVSFETAASWNEPGEELVIREVSIKGPEMGSIALRGTLGSISKDVFSPDSAVALVALMGATVKTANLTVENKGLVERLIAREAKKNRKSSEDVRREYGMGAAVMVPAMLGNSTQAKAIGQAVAKFLAKPGRLEITARTKDPAGLGIADFMSLGEPAEILDRLEVNATAQ